MSSVNGMRQVFQQFNADGSRDSKGNATLDRAELAKAAVELHKRGDEDSLVQASILATMVIPRGEYELGLFPDYDGDHFVSTTEMEQLAARTGSADQFESSDFGVDFPNRGEAAEYTVSDLEEIANEPPATDETTETEGAEGPADNQECQCDDAPDSGGDPPADATPANPMERFAALFVTILGRLFSGLLQ